MAPAATTLAKLEQNRQALKDVLTHLETELADDVTTPMNQNHASFLYGMVKTAHTDNLANHKAILEALPVNLADHQLEFSDLCKRVTRLMAAYAGINSRFVPAAAPPPPPGATTHDIRLPKLELPTFDGSLHHWVSFHDLFNTAIHSKTKLSKCEKLTYLKSLLRGDAARLIQTLTVSDANYDLAWKKLIDRYQNERELVFSVFRRFLAQPNLPHATAQGVRELVDVSLECVRSLEVFSINLDKGLDAFLMFLLFRKLDDGTRQLWEQQLPNDNKLPPFQALVDFLEQRARALSSSGTTKPPSAGGNKPSYSGDRNRNSPRASVHHTTTTCQVCCQPFHPLFKCPSFASFSVPARHDAVKKARACFNCLGEGHGANNCPSSRSCRHCGERHHTLLHRQQQQQQVAAPAATDRRDPSVQTMHTAAPPAATATIEKTETLLATAVVLLTDRHGHQQKCRALLDSCSTRHFMTEECSRRLGLVHKRTHLPISGLGQEGVGVAKSLTFSAIAPHFEPSERISAEFLVVPKISSKVPCNFVNYKRFSHLQGLQFADPHFFRPSNVDILLGSDIFYAVIGTEKKTGEVNDPVAINTSFGWLVGGGREVPATPIISLITHLEHESTAVADDEALDVVLQKFWELEAVPTAKLHTEEEEKCEEHFQRTTRQQEDGRYVVSLPRRQPTPQLGTSLQIAVRRLKQVERRLQKNASHLEDYQKFMREYEDMGHMVEVPPPADDGSVIFIPHHFVLKESSTTTKFRVILDASADTSTGVSLNDTLIAGPTIQDNLADLIMRFRTHAVALTADITKMYRQILVEPEETHLQHILWRDDPSKPIKYYKLLTVSYGTASAPFIATRVLKEIADTHAIEYPLASEVLEKDFFMDDLMSGVSSVKEAIELRPQLQELCETGKLPLRKWTSSSQEVLDSIPPELRETQSLFSIDSDTTIKALGIFWNAKTDTFNFKSSLTICKSTSTHLTKRQLSSSIARLFDPIGWLSPVVIGAKIMMQKTWAANIPWDTELPQQLKLQWEKMTEDFVNLEKIHIPRFYGTGSVVSNLRTTDPSIRVCLIGFCDASEVAYAAAVYIGVYTDTNRPCIALITSKTRVAPCKKVSLPRLELCGALLLAELIQSVNRALKIKFYSTTAWTDSTVTLAWIRGHPSKWPTFVANRVTKIQTLLPSNQWGHVSGITNPADCASRGISSSELVDHPLWWHGPSWLLDGVPTPQASNVADADPPEEPIVLSTSTEKSPHHFMENFSDLHRLQRVTAYILRFIINCRTRLSISSGTPTTVLVPSMELTPVDLNNSLVQLVKWIQEVHFGEDIQRLQQKQTISNKSRLLPLHPFLDGNGVLRVGGRLRNSTLPVDRKNPILLPSNSHLTTLLIRAAHHDNFHAGPQLVQSTLFQRYWILRGRDAIRHQIRKCVICTRHAAKTQEQFMGDLPSSRVNPCRPFEKCGVDYAGPFLIKPNLPRSKTTLKCYLSVFVCFVSRALHLELVSDLSTSAFQAALRRFVSRRGRPVEIHSDCGTNFVGASRELKEWLVLTRTPDFNNKVSTQCTQQGIIWKFIPPGAPHFGGLWEAGVKSVKFHLKRILSPHRLTYEELSTITIQVEACLNSRPLTAASSDPNDLTVLTPGHFLIGAPLTAVPEPDYTTLNTSHLDRWQLLQQIQQHFWRRWSSEFLTRLQQRPKWASSRSDLKANDLVLIKNELLPPQQWKLGRIVEVHPGPDSIARVATVRTSDGVLKRPFVKLCLLPIISD